MRMVFLGSMTKTERMVKAMPLESTLVASWWSILARLSVFVFRMVYLPRCCKLTCRRQERPSSPCRQ